MVGCSATLSTLPTSGILKATMGNILEDNLNDTLADNIAAKTVR
jgi:hypothetical protein